MCESLNLIIFSFLLIYIYTLTTKLDLSSHTFTRRLEFVLEYYCLSFLVGGGGIKKWLGTKHAQVP